MPRRIELELTSARDDGTWTWRAAGARQPKGELDGTLLPAGAAVGDVLRAEVAQTIDGIDVVSIHAPKAERSDPERLDLVSRPEPDQLVTTVLAGRGGRARDDRGGRGGRRPRRDGEDRDRRPRRDRSGDDRPGGSRRRPGEGRGERDRSDAPGGEGDRRRSHRPARSERPRRPPPPARPRPKRLRAGRAHRKTFLEGLPEEQRPVAEQVLRGGIPAVRQAVTKQNEQSQADGRPTVKAEPLVAMAEKLLPGLRSAEWRDKAEAALADLEELDLRDLRSVVVAADTGARDDESRELAARLRDALGPRVEQAQSEWLNELAATLADDRIVRALRLSSRPPKAGAPLPPDLAGRLTDAATAALTADATSDRWVTVLDALQFAPVHARVEPPSLPEKPSDALLAMVRKTAGRLPQIAARFGVEAAAPTGRSGGRAAGGRRRRSRAKGEPPPPGEPAGTTEPTGGDKPSGQEPAAVDTASPPAPNDAAEPPAASDDTPDPGAPASSPAGSDDTPDPGAPASSPAGSEEAADPKSPAPLAPAAEAAASTSPEPGPGPADDEVDDDHAGAVSAEGSD